MRPDHLVAVSVDAEVCVGIGACVMNEPTAFDLGDDGVSYAIPSVRLPRDRAAAVAAGCPSGAIAIVADADADADADAPRP